MYQRIANVLNFQSFFLLGARGTGKSTFLNLWAKETFNRVITYDLLDIELHFKFKKNPRLLLELLEHEDATGLLVIIDEIQKNPELLDYVHMIIERKKIIFALTGSSARKLKRNNANLLAGRALQNYMHPLTHIELDSDFNLQHVLEWGSLPFITGLKTDLHKKEYLKSYCNTYLKEEIKEEQVVRKIEPFLRFLEIAAQMSGEEVNLNNIAKDSGVDSSAIERYYEIMIDTLLMFELPPFHLSARKRQSKRSRYYFFDLGVKRCLENTLGIELRQGKFGYGKMFEHFFILEIFRINDYFRKDFKLSYLRTKDNCEIDLIIETSKNKFIAIEIKSSTSLHSEEFTHQAKLVSDIPNCQFWVVYQGKDKLVFNQKELAIKCDVLPWQMAIKNLIEI